MNLKYYYFVRNIINIFMKFYYYKINFILIISIIIYENAY